MTISRGSGFRMCRMFDPGSVGLNGAYVEYGLGTPSDVLSSGMYALGRGSAVVRVTAPPGLCESSTAAWNAAA